MAHPITGQRVELDAAILWLDGRLAIAKVTVTPPQTTRRARDGSVTEQTVTPSVSSDGVGHGTVTYGISLTRWSEFARRSMEEWPTSYRCGQSFDDGH